MEHVFHYPSTLDSEDQMLDDLHKVLEASKITGDSAWRLTLAVSEAFTNALVHGNGKNPLKTITLRVQVNENSVVADIADEGAGGLVRIQKRQKPSSLMAEGGRGIDLIEHYTDGVTFSESSQGGLTVSITVKMPGRTLPQAR